MPIQEDMPEARHRMKEGMKFLDEKRPGWRNDLWGFRMSEPQNCILCHVMRVRTFSEALAKLELTREDAIRFGFLRGPDDPCTFYGNLQHVWSNEAMIRSGEVMEFG